VPLRLLALGFTHNKAQTEEDINANFKGSTKVGVVKLQFYSLCFSSNFRLSRLTQLYFDNRCDSHWLSTKTTKQKKGWRDVKPAKKEKIQMCFDINGLWPIH
jgi:hypothetical protein